MYARRQGRFGGLGPPPAVTGVLQDVYNVANQYLTSTTAMLSGAQYGTAQYEASLALGPLQYASTALDFSSGTGAQVVNGSMDWSSYRDQLNSFIQGILQVQTQAGIDTTQMAGWYLNTATPALAQLTLTAPVAQVAGGVANTAAGAGQQVAAAVPVWVWIAGGLALAGYVLSQARGLGGARALSGYSRRKRRAR